MGKFHVVIFPRKLLLPLPILLSSLKSPFCPNPYTSFPFTHTLSCVTPLQVVAFYEETLVSVVEEGSPSSDLGVEEVTTTTMAPIMTTTTINTHVCDDYSHVCWDLCCASHHPRQLLNLLIYVVESNDLHCWIYVEFLFKMLSQQEKYDSVVVL